MRIAIDASAAAGPAGSGVPRYVRQLSAALALITTGELILCYRPSRIRHRARVEVPATGCVRQRLLLAPFDPWLEHKVDVFHGPDARLPALRRPALVATVHDLFSLISDRFGPESFRRKKAAFYNDIARRADLILTVSQHSRADILQHLGVEPERVQVVHVAAAGAFGRARPEDLARVRAGYDLPERYVLFVGDVSARKNVAGLVRAFRALANREHAGGCSLIVVGKDGYGAAEARRAAEGAPPRQIRFLGHAAQSDLPALYAGARVFAFPTLYEGFGVPVLEAFQSGVPVVAGNRTSLPEVAGDAALLVDPEDEEALASAVERAIRDETLREELKAKGARRAQAFSWERCATETLAAYRWAVERKESG